MSPHSGDVILVATAIDRVLGVDVERIKVTWQTPRLQPGTFAMRMQNLACTPPEARGEAFFAAGHGRRPI
jgi:phosphopantetheinyl transferase